MKILKQPQGYDYGQPLLNKFLRVHVALMHNARRVNDYDRTWTNRTFYDAETREILTDSNWRVKLIKKLGT